jgi:hypothetical protein
MGERDNEGTVAGTPAFMAPEQARGEVTPACDQYALGRTLLFALVGKLPSRSADAMDAPFFAPETSVENFSVDVPAPLRAVVARATAPDPRDRYPSITAFAEALAAIDLGEAAGRARPSLLEPVRPVERFTWTVGARAIETLGGDLEKAEFSLGALVKAGLVDRARAKAFCASTGYRDFAWAVYARRETLGAIASGRALAAARFAVVLCHGLFTSRHIWRPVAVAVCRNNPQAVVLAPDLYGTGESSCRDDVTEAQLEPTALKTVLRKWIALIGLEGVPQVLLGHSFSAMAVLAATDADFGPNVRRVAMTPLFPCLAPRAGATVGRPAAGAEAAVL